MQIALAIFRAFMRFFIIVGLVFLVISILITRYFLRLISGFTKTFAP